MPDKTYYSFTGLDQYSNCPMSFENKYIKRYFVQDDTLSTRLGSLLHKAKEEISRCQMQGITPAFSDVKDMVLYTGYRIKNKNGKPDENLLSVAELKEMFPTEWNEEDPKSGMTYDEKLEIFFSHLDDDFKDDEWETLGVEVPFEYEIRPNIILHGFIDKIQGKGNELRVVDYKSSKKVYDQQKLNTPLQLYIYALACEDMYQGCEVTECLYDFILLGQVVQGGTKGWRTRAKKKLDRILDGIEESKVTGVWKPNPSPLCHWCPYCAHTLSGDSQYKDECPYYSLWTPEYKKFGVNEEYDESLALKRQEMKQASKEFIW